MRVGSASVRRRAIAPPRSGRPGRAAARADGEEESGHERCQVGAGSVTVGSGPAFAVTGQAQRQYPVGPGEGGDDPPPAGSALLVPVQEEQRRSGAGFQILGFHPVDRDPAIMKNDLSPGPGVATEQTYA